MKRVIRNAFSIIRKIPKVFFWRGFSRRNKAASAIFGIIILGFSSLYIWNAIHPQAAVGAWWNTNWAYRKAINISAHTSLENNVYLNLASGNAIDTSDSSRFQADCGDLRFTDQSGNILPYYIVSGCGTATTVVHVFMSTFPAGAQTVYYYYGNPSAPDGFSSSDFQTAATSVSFATLGSEENGPAPVAYWKFDDGFGTVASNSATQAPNASIYNMSNPPIGSSGWQTENQCISGKCLSFDGTNDYISTNNITSDLITSSEGTISVWIKPDKTISSFTHVYDGYGIVDDFNGFIGIYRANASTTCADGSTGDNIYVYNWDTNQDCVGIPYTPGQWMQVTWVHTGGRLYAYKNGQLVNSVASGNTGNMAGLVTIGARTPNRYYPGFIDEVKIYKYGRSASQVLSDYNSRGSSTGANVLGASNQNLPSALSDGLVGYWEMDETSGNASDSSGNSLTLTNNGTTPFNTGEFGNAPTFNGSSTYFNTATATSGVQTVAFWVNPASTTDNYINLASGVYINSTSGTISTTGFTNPKIYVNGVISSTVTSGVWQHVVITSTAGINANAFEIGRANGSYGANNSQIDEIRIYNRALTGADVSSLYNWAPGPLAYYNFEESQGTVLNDTSGSGNNGSWFNGTNGIQWATGKYSEGGNFTGSNFSSGSYASITRTVSEDFTLEAWINTTTNPGGTGTFNSADGIIMSDFPSDVATFGMSIWENPAKIYFGDSNGGVTIKSGTGIADGKWHHIVGTRNKTTGLLSLYVDGVLVSTGTGNTKSLTSNSKIFIGRTNAGQYFHGKMDEVRIYNYVRNSKQIVSDMNAGHPSVGTAMPIVNWKFDEGYGTTARNSGISAAGAASLVNMASPATPVSGWSQDGKIKKALSFDGINDYAETGDLFYSDALTVCAWVNESFIDSNARSIVIKRNTTGTTAGTNEWSLAAVSGNIFWQSWWNGGTTIGANVGGSTVLAPNRWYHVCGVQQGVGQLAYVYVNGQLDGSGTQSNAMNDTTMHIQVGALSNGNTNRYWNGKVDEVHIYDYALSPSEILAEYNQASSVVAGSLSDTSGLTGGTIASNSASAEYCVPGDTASCASPVGRWDFEEGIGNSVNDSTGNANTGTWNGTLGSQWVLGKVSKGGNFNGTNNYVSTSAPVTTSTSAFTLSVWAKMTSLGASHRGIIYNGVSGTNGYGIYVDHFDGFIKVEFPGVAGYDTLTTMPTNQWTHLECTFASSTLKCYKNGIQILSTSASTPNTPGTATYLGTGSTSTGFFSGQIDNARIYNYARSAAQVAWDYNHGGPFAYWKMDECQGTAINDSSGNGNKGTLTIGGSGTYTTPGTCSVSSVSSAWYNGGNGKYNASMAFDGTDDAISVPSNSSFSNISFTISAWVKPQNVAGSWQAILEHNDSGNNWYGLWKSGNGSMFHFRWSQNGTASSDFNTTISSGNWYHVVGVYDATTTTAKMYLNGKLDKTVTGAGAGSAVNSGLNIGSTTASSQYFSGQIDDSKVFNYPLTASQVKTLYNQGAAVRFGPITGTP